MTLLDVAQAMRGKLRDGYSAPQAGGAAMTSEMAYGTARADSVGGFVEIVMDNMPAGADPDDYAFTVACDAPISSGDRVALVTINGTSKAVSTATLASIAQSASATATATNQFFFHDANGAHVATVAGDPDSGRNVTLNSYGLLFRDGTTDLAEFTPTEIKLGENSTHPTVSDPDGSVSISMLDVFNLAAKWILFNSPDGATTGGVALDIDAHTTQVQNLHAFWSAMVDGDIGAGNFYYDKFGNASIRGAAAYLTSSAAQSTVAGTDTKLTLGASIIATSGELFEKSSNGIKCFGYVSQGTSLGGNVLVSAQVYCNNMTSNNNLVISVYKNSTKLWEVGVSPANTSGMATAVIPPRAVYAAPNDVFYLYAKSTTAVTNGIPIGGAALTVQYI